VLSLFQTAVQSLRPVDAIFIACLATMVVVPDGSALGLLVFGLWGMAAFFRQAKAGRLVSTLYLGSARLRSLLGLLWAFCIGNALILAYHGASSSEYEQLIPFILLPFATWLLARQPIELRYFFWAVALAAASSGLFALIQVLWFDMPHESRASGWMANPIHFGHLCVLLGAYCLIGLLGSWGRQSCRADTALLTVGFALALLGAVLSGSKSSWVALGVFFLFLAGLGFRAQQFGKAGLAKFGFGFGLLFAAFIALSPSSQRLQTFQNSITSLATALASSDRPFNLNELNLDPSVNDRLAQYQMSAELVAQNPWLGISRPAITVEQQTRVDQAEPGFKRVYRHIHSEYLDTLVNRGLFGLVLLAAMFFALFWALKRPFVWLKPEPSLLALDSFAPGRTESRGASHAEPRGWVNVATGQSVASLLGASTLVLLATMALFDILLSRVSVMAPGLFVLAYCLAWLHGPQKNYDPAFGRS
jgi:O-antigen ligase